MRGFQRWMLVPVMRVWFHSREPSFDSIPHPAGDGVVETDGERTLSVLIVGHGPAVGWGVSTHALGLPGALARALTERTARGVRVATIVGQRHHVHSPELRTDRLGLDGHDSVVLTLGTNAALRLRSLRFWRRELARFLDETLERTRPGAPIIVAGVGPLSRITIFDSLAGRIAERHGTAMNVLTSSLCARNPRTIFVPVDYPRTSDPTRVRSPTDYDHLAALIADAIAPALPKGD